MSDYQTVIDTLKLEALPGEGGYFRRMYECDEKVKAACLSDDYTEARPFSTAIYFLLTAENFSALHKLTCDEVWHFYEGDPVTIVRITDDGELEQFTLGTLSQGHQPQHVMKRGHWFGAYLDKATLKQGYALVGCTCSPGFEYADFTLGDKQALVIQFPWHEILIHKLTR